jgi:hypothetical protein
MHKPLSDAWDPRLPPTYKPLKISSNYVSDPVFETNLAVSTLLKLCVNLQTMPGTIFIIGWWVCSERLRQAIASEQLNTSQPMFKPIYEVFVYSLSACFTDWMIILYMTCVNNFSGIYMLSRNIRITFRVFYCKALSDHLLTFLLQRIISVDN